MSQSRGDEGEAGGPDSPEAGRALDTRADDAAWQALLALMDDLEEQGLQVSLDELRQRAADRRILPVSRDQLEALIEEAIRDGVLFRDARRMVDRSGDTPRRVLLLRLNWRHPLVSRMLGEG